MPISYCIHDLSAFSCVGVENCEDFPSGQIFIQDGNVHVAAGLKELQGQHLDFTKDEFPRLLNRRPKVLAHAITVVNKSLRLVAQPVGAPIALDSYDGAAGWLLLGDGPSIGVALDKPVSEAAYSLSAGVVEFHENQPVAQVGWPEWDVTWLNEHNEPVFSMSHRRGG